MIYEKVKAAHILVISSPIWLGEKSSVCTKVIERLYSTSTDLNALGQYSYYGRVGGCLITGNEDGVKHCSMNILYSLQHLGYTIPPQADAGWIGEAGPGPSYLDPGSGAPEKDFTNRNTTFMNVLRVVEVHRGLSFLCSYDCAVICVSSTGSTRCLMPLSILRSMMKWGISMVSR